MKKGLSELEFLKYKIKVLNKIGLAFSAETDIDKLFEMILAETINLTGADAGSIYMVDHIEGNEVLVFKNFINHSSSTDFKGETLKIDEQSMTGYVALHGESILINNLDEDGESFPFKINKSYDKRLRYKTQNVLTVPMKNNTNEVLGVLQILNKKDNFDFELLVESDFINHVIPFDEDDIEMILSLASQTAVLVERLSLNQKLSRNVSLTRTTLINFFNSMKTAMSQIGEDILDEQEKFKKYATLDPLTGLMTKQEGVSFFKQQLEFARFNGVKVVVSFIDANDLKVVNDNFGHLAGDNLLKNIGQIIQDTARQNDIIFRYGGDEFILIFYNADLKAAERIWIRILSKLEEFNNQSGLPYQLSVSYGLSEYDYRINQSIDELISEADKKMYEYKRIYKQKKNSLM